MTASLPGASDSGQPAAPGARSILIVEDDATVSEIVARYLAREGFTVEVIDDGVAAIARVATKRPDLVLLDIMLPGLSGLDVCRRLKATNVPIIMLTARGEESDRILGLELGADDYVVKPFSPRELVARVKSVLRRAQAPSSAASRSGREVIRLGGIELDPRAQSVSVGSRQVELTVREFELLFFLMQNPGTVFRRDELLEHVWGYTFGGTATVTVHVQRLRRKIERDPENPIRIATVWGVGYRFDP